MTPTKRMIVDRIWAGRDPFDGQLFDPTRVDYQGWASDNPMLQKAMIEISPKIIVEVGVWKGGSVLTMADVLRSNRWDAVIVAVDTWLGAAEHWTNLSYFQSLKIEDAYPTLFKTFVNNVISKNLEDYIVPIPLDSINAASVLRNYGIKADMIHIDGGHDFNSVLNDLRVWWPMLNDGGILVGDDYHPIGIDVWPEVRAAFHDFFDRTEFENFQGKCIVRKTGP